MSTSDFRLPFEHPIFELEDQIEALEASEHKTPELRDRIRELRKQLTETTRAIYNNLDAWETVKVSIYWLIVEQIIPTPLSFC